VIAMQSGPTIANLPIVLLLAAFLVVFVVVRSLGARRRKAALKDSAAAGARPSSGAMQQTAPAEHYAKRCPTCKSIYADETLAFCLSDGSTLERVAAPTHERDPNATLVYGDAPRSNLAPTVPSNPEEPGKQ
jgi:predicted lipid-binding transport protein (Tim44 family)